MTRASTTRDVETENRLRQKIGMTDDPERQAEYRREIRRLKMQARRADDGHR